MPNSPGDIREFHSGKDHLVVTSQAKKANDKPGQFALGLALTNECNLACSFCYRDPDRVDRLTLDQVRAVMERLDVETTQRGLHITGYELVGCAPANALDAAARSRITGLRAAQLLDPALFAPAD